MFSFHGSYISKWPVSNFIYVDRYFNEASLRLDSNHWELMKQGQPKVPTINKFLSELATTHYTEHKKPIKVGIDAFVHSATFAKDLNEAFVNAAKDVDVDVGEDVVATNGDTGMEAEVPVIAELDTLDGKLNIVDSIWEGRPDLPKNPFRVQVCSPFFVSLYHCNAVER